MRKLVINLFYLWTMPYASSIMWFYDIVIYVIERKCLQCVHVWNHEVWELTDTDFIEVLKCSSIHFILVTMLQKVGKW